jgi:adenylate cyclase
MYWLIFGWGLTASLPLAFVLIVGPSLLIGQVTRNHRIALYAQLVSIMMITGLIQWSIGGLYDSGFVFAWAILGPLGALLFFPPRRSTPWFALYAALLAITLIFDGTLSGHALEVSPTIRRLFFAMNLGVSSLIVFAFAGYFVTAANRERRRANALLLNVLPASVAETLKLHDGTIAEHYDSVSVLFADIGGSTPLFATMMPAEVVDWLNEVFSVLDDVVDRHGLEKLRTMGDNYMVGSGVPSRRLDHATALVRCALEMVDAVDRLPPRNGTRIQLRYGINSGPVVAGVIGKSKFHYDLWGDTVNVASRMESSGELGRIQVSADTHALLDGEFRCEPRGTILVKGKGEMETWFVLGAAATA